MAMATRPYIALIPDVGGVSEARALGGSAEDSEDSTAAVDSGAAWVVADNAVPTPRPFSAPIVSGQKTCP